MRPVDLMLDEENELKFKVNVEGNRPGTATSRFVVEGPEMDFVFKGFPIPSLTGSIDFTPTPTFFPATTKTSYSWKNTF